MKKEKSVKIAFVLLGIIVAIIIVFAVVNYFYNNSKINKDSLDGQLFAIKKGPNDCNPPCDACNHNCVGIVGSSGDYVYGCYPNGKTKCDDGRCVVDKSDCDCPPPKPKPECLYICDKTSGDYHWVMNSNLKSCPAGGNGCCLKSEECCYNDPEAGPMCCNPMKCVEPVCKTLGALGSIIGKHLNYCNTDKCNPETEIKCTSGGNSICCPKDIDTYCGEQRLGTGIRPTGTMVPTCVEEKCDKDEFLCLAIGIPIPFMTRNKVCCKTDAQECKTEKTLAGDIYYCSNIQCTGNGETLCESIGESKGKAGICCTSDKKCRHHPSGLPKCD